MSEETPHVVNIQGSTDLDTFLSEFPSEGPDGPSVVAVEGAQALDAFAATDAAIPAQPEVVEASLEPGANEVRFPPEEARVKPDSTESSPIAVEPRAAAKAGLSAKPATVTEFPVHATRPPTPATAALVPTPITLVELLDKQGGLEWRQAVAVIHQICGILKQQPPHQPILLEPRNILITHEGQVRLVPALSAAGDPLVIQLGRLLRAMLTGNDAPPELRLLLAQATFELPIFESVEDVDRALVQLEKLDEKMTKRHEFVNPINPPATETQPLQPEAVARAGRSILPKPHPSGRRGSSRKASILNGLYAQWAYISLAALAAVALAAGITIKPSLIWPSVTPAAKTPTTVVAPVSTSTPPAAAEPAVESASPPRVVPPASRAANSAPTVTIPAPPLVPVDPPRERDRARTTNNRPAVNVAGAGSSGAPGGDSAAARPSAPTTGTAVSSRESERRAASLIAQGQTEKAGIVFDALLLSNPLYEPDPSSLTPEALEAFRTSQRNLLPNIAQKNFDRARVALTSGDADRALTLGREVMAILDRRIAEPPAHLREQVDDLINAASAAKSQADEIVYTTADKGVVAPRELSRQFPASGPLGVPPHRVGTLEMIIDKDGGVEFVKLHTPLNRYHERMIVSAAKAWRYRPATRNGKPVKYRLTVRINLPESGTDF
jgi:hypothetical protein